MVFRAVAFSGPVFHKIFFKLRAPQITRNTTMLESTSGLERQEVFVT